MFGIVAFFFCLAATANGADGSQIWGYGTGIKGFPLMYSDGGAYVGRNPPPNASLATNVTLTQNDDGSLLAQPTNKTSSTANWPSPFLFINTNEGAFASAGFTSKSNTSVTTTNFRKFGTLLVWVDDSGEIESKWYADKIDDDIWVVKWNVDNVISDTAVPLVLKSLPPSTKEHW